MIGNRQMANITAAMVKDLREKTGAGMMDCKTALGETNGDMEAAVDWVHNQVSDGLGKIGVLVALESSGNADELTAIGRQVAMHIAFANPIAIDAGGVDPAVVKREKDILADKFRQQGKAEAMIEKITESGLKTFYKEQTLLEQPFIFDDKKSVRQALKEAEGKVGGPIKVTGFVRYALGEGIEKATSDFAAEVAAAGGAT